MENANTEGRKAVDLTVDLKNLDAFSDALAIIRRLEGENASLRKQLETGLAAVLADGRALN